MRCRILLFCLLALVSRPAWAAPSPGFEALEQQLASMVAAKPGEFGIAALDLGSGTTVSFNGNQTFPMASTVKVAVAATYLSQVDFGRRSLSDPIGKLTAETLIERMLTRSDNWATDQLLKDLGGPQTVDAWLRWNGLTEIRIDRTIAQLLADRRDLRDPRDSSTPIAMINLLRKIDTGEVLKSESRSFLLSLMRRCITGPNRIRGLLPAGTQVEHKTGTLAGLTDDVGFITLPNGRRIAVALFARGGTNRSRTIAEAARAIYDGFSAKMGTAFAAAGGAN